MIGICHELRIVLNTVLCFRRREGRGKKGGRERRKEVGKEGTEGRKGGERETVCPTHWIGQQWDGALRRKEEDIKRNMWPKQKTMQGH
jgi:hypothetical protein